MNETLVLVSAACASKRYVHVLEDCKAVVMNESDGNQIGQTFSSVALREAQARAWIAPDDDGNLRITKEGRDAVRRWRSLTSASRAASDPDTDRSPADLARPLPAVNPGESPLAWLASRKDAAGRPMLHPWEIDAGERLRADLTFAQLTPRVTMSWSGTPGNRTGGAGPGTRDLADNVVAARARVTTALRAVGPEFSDLLIDVCGHLRGLEEIARSERWPRRAARLLLQRALSSLARHYGIAPHVAVEERIARRLRHWGADGYRPSVSLQQSDDQPD